MFILNREIYYSIQNKRKKMIGHRSRFREQRLPEQLIDEQNNPKFTFAFVANQVCAQLLVWKYMSPVRSLRTKLKSFSCETFCTSTCSEKEVNGNSEVEVKSECNSWVFLLYIKVCPWEGGEKVTNFPTRRLCPKLRTLSTLQSVFDFFHMCTCSI